MSDTAPGATDVSTATDSALTFEESQAKGFFGYTWDDADHTVGGVTGEVQGAQASPPKQVPSPVKDEPKSKGKD